MYCSFYGFSKKPFEVTPDPGFLYSSRTHREALASLIYGIRERRGFIAVLGEAGTGKTTLLRSALEHLGEEVKTAYIFNTDLAYEDMLHLVLMDLGLAEESERLTKAEALHRLNELAIRQLSEGGNLVIIVDEAQDLDRRCMENLRLLSNLETSRNKLVQIILSGQPELEEKLGRPDLRQLSQRINLRRYLLPFTQAETHGYIQHRLKVAQYDGPALFTGEAEKLIWQYSGGIPRKINTVCDNALLIGYAVKERKITGDTVQEVIDDLSQNTFRELFNARGDESEGRSQPPGAASPRRRVASVPVILLIAYLTLMTGMSLGVLGLYLKAQHRFPFQNTVQAEMPEMQARVSGPIHVPEKQADPETSTLTAALAADPAEKEFSPVPVTPEICGDNGEPCPTPEQAEPPPVRQKPAGKENAEIRIEPDSEPATEAPAEHHAVVKAGAGDTLFGIIMENYGKYSKDLEQKVLRANPDIKDPDRIYLGQHITIPEPATSNP